MPYLDYTQGTITLTNNSRSVIGNKTYWLQKIHPNDILKVMTDDQETGQIVSDFYIVEKVISDTQLLLIKEYLGETRTDVHYAIQRMPEQFLNTELATAQLKILDKITGLDTSLDEAREHATQAGISANAAKQYAAEAENSMNAAISAADRAEALEQDCIQYRDEAQQAAQTATEQAGISTEKADVSTEQANIAVTTVTNFINSGNKPGGAVIVDESGKILESLIPGSVKDVKSYPTASDFPPTGETGFIYLAIDTQKVYLWAGSPANMYVPVDTQLSLEGTGTAQTAARSDHHHDGIYEPAHTEYVWNGILTGNINLNTFIKDGNYLISGNVQNKPIVDGVEYEPTALISKSFILNNTEGGDILSYGHQIQTILANTDVTGMIKIYRMVVTTTTTNNVTTINATSPWQFAFASDSLRLGGSKYHFVTEQEYNTGISDGSITTNDVAFIEETADNASFAVRSVNGIYPDGTGNIQLSGGNKTILANPTDYPLYRNANNIKTDGERVMITVALYGTVENFPVSDASAMFIRCYIAETTKFQDCYVLKADGSTELWQRFGTTTAWKAWSKVSGGAGGNTDVKQIVFAGAIANEVKVIPIPRNENYTGLPIEVLKFVARDGVTVIMGGTLNLNNSANFDITDNVVFNSNSATLNNRLILNSVTTDECLIDLSVLMQYEDWRIG